MRRFSLWAQETPCHPEAVLPHASPILGLVCGMVRKLVPVHRRCGDTFAFYKWMLTDIPKHLGIRCVEKVTMVAAESQLSK